MKPPKKATHTVPMTRKDFAKKRRGMAKADCEVQSSFRDCVSSIGDFQGLKWHLRMPGSVYK